MSDEIDILRCLENAVGTGQWEMSQDDIDQLFDDARSEIARLNALIDEVVSLHDERMTETAMAKLRGEIFGRKLSAVE